MFVGACAQRKIAGRRLQDMMVTRKANAAARAMWRSSRQRQRVRLTRLALCNATSTGADQQGSPLGLYKYR